MIHQPTNQLAHILLSTKIISAPRLQKGIELAQQQNRSLLATLVSEGMISAETICQTCATYYQLNIIDLNEISLKNLPHQWIDADFCKKHLILPIEVQQNYLKIAVCNPEDLLHLEEMKFRTGLTIKPAFASYTDLSNVINTYLSKYYVNAETPIITLVEQVITNAIMKHASDIHFEPTISKQLRLRLRIDGLLHAITEFSPDQANLILSRLKIMANLDITLQRLPQDGRFTFKTAQGLLCDCRISTCPTLLGEKIVLRLLESKQQLLDINELGLNQTSAKQLVQSLSQPQGLILVTGPTGSGKTQTLYSALTQLNQEYVNILTVEDPVEIQLPNINQVHVNEKIGLNFSTVLRAFLRQDPDIILIGEIRDLETAKTAIRAAQTGHLVLSTLHTNSAQETIVRLCSMGIPRYQLTSSIICIVAQRLARCLCNHCKIPYEISIEEWRSLSSFPPDTSNSSITLYQSSHCQYCLNGYKGRCGIFEIISFSMINETQKISTDSLWQAGLEKVSQGITSLQEIYRVIQHE